MQLSMAISKKHMTERVLLPLCLSLVLAVSAQINVALYPVPITLQSLAILFIGLLCSPQTATLAVGYYLVEIAAGLPFASGFSGGLFVLLSPRAGYFVGFLAAAYIAATIAARSRSLLGLTVAAIAGIVAVYVPGVAWLSIMFGIEKALTVGLYPFLTEIPAFIAIAVIASYNIHQFKMKSQR